MAVIDLPNLNYIKELSGGDLAFEQKFIGIVKDEFPLEKKEYLECLKSNKLSDAAEVVHKLKHKFNILGLEKSYKLAVIYEDELQQGNTGLDTDFLEILEVIDNYILTV